MPVSLLYVATSSVRILLRSRSETMEGEGGTPLFPDLGRHCALKSCNQLDFLPFKCDACHRLFCAEHSSCAQHDCPRADAKDRVVVICPACSAAVIKPYHADPALALQKHAQSGECDPAKRPRERPACPVSGCKQILTFSNSYLCKSCRRKTCLKHRFPSDHRCASGRDGSAETRFLSALARRQGKDCANGDQGRVGEPACRPVLEAR